MKPGVFASHMIGREFRQPISLLGEMLRVSRSDFTPGSDRGAI